ncbi:Os06g0190550, partial [Oryza sativa Japonica Group]
KLKQVRPQTLPGDLWCCFLSKKLLLLCCFLYAHGVSWRPQQKPKAVSFSNFIFCKRLCYLFGLSLKSRLHA